MLATDKVVLIVIFLIVLLAVLFIMFGLGKGNADQILLQNELRNCCGTFRAYDCLDMTVSCDGDTIDSLRTKLSMTQEQIKLFCNCE
jgi:hypothetical protein